MCMHLLFVLELSLHSYTFMMRCEKDRKEFTDYKKVQNGLHFFAGKFFMSCRSLKRSGMVPMDITVSFVEKFMRIKETISLD